MQEGHVLHIHIYRVEVAKEGKRNRGFPFAVRCSVTWPWSHPAAPPACRPINNPPTRNIIITEPTHMQNDGISFSGFDGCFWHLEYLVYLSTMLESCSNCLLHHLVSLPLQLQDSTADTLLIWWAWPLSRDKSVFVGFHSNMFLSPLCVETFPSSFLTLFNFRGIHL